MRCVFCKAQSDDSRSVEHIVPESMGNAGHVLPRGTVCDACNGYFARKIEQPLLATPLFRQLRSRMEIPNKRGRIPEWDSAEETAKPSYRLMGRFLAKVALEVLAFKTLSVEGWNDELVEKSELDDLRQYARYNIGGDWPFAVRALHPVDAVFLEGESGYHLLHEFDILLTKRSEMYLVLSLFGVELVLNLGGPVLNGYQAWLEENANVSPLYARSLA